ncbi:MAG: transposase, ISNCY family [Methyloprofundus sp.]|nr:MAG: transposase, ISNCY family [Methyloprofundus sp.]
MTHLFHQIFATKNLMRNVISSQLEFGQIDIAHINIDVTSRDDISLILLGLQHIYTTASLKKAVFKILQEIIPHKGKKESDETEAVSANKGRPGMEQWSILVLGTLRLALNADYDRIQELANQHRTLRMMLGLGDFDDKSYRLQTLKDNLKLFTPDIMERINLEVIRAGHQLLGLNESTSIQGRCDSFVLKTDVHFPTDINLLHDAIRVLVRQCLYWSKDYYLPDWRQHKHNLARFKKQYRKIQRLRHSTSRDETKKQLKADEIIKAHRLYIDLAQVFLDRAIVSYDLLKGTHAVSEILLEDMKTFRLHGERQINQIRRRVIEGEKIPHDEKVFSLFQPHTEWIKKGKAGIPVELGVRVCILEDDHGFILHHKVMQKETDDKIAVEMVKATQEKFPKLNACSFDKGFHSKANQSGLKEILDQVTLPKKGKLSVADKEHEYAEEFKQAKKKHSAVESAINALQVHGLSKCRDHGIEAFERYAALAILAGNIQQVGAIKRTIERKRLIKQNRKVA